jgi:hypothetical protein
LRRISSELKLPEPVKARILLEMAADLEALYEHYCARGLAEEEAARLTEEKLLASPEALQHLIVVHTTGYQRWLGRAAERLRWGLDLLLFLLGVGPVVVIATWVVAAQVEAMLADPFVWPLLAAVAAVTVLAVWKALQLFRGRVTPTAELHRGLALLLFLGVVAPAFAAAAFLIRLHGVSMQVVSGRAAPEAMLAAMEPLVHSATLLGMGLLLGIGAGLVWFVLVNRIAAIEQAESAALLAG